MKLATAFKMHALYVDVETIRVMDPDPKII